MPVQKRSKGSSKSKKTIRRRTMRGGDITEKMIAYLKSKNITDEQITDAISAAEPEPATDDSLLKTFSNETDITKADYENWSNVNSQPLNINDEGEEELPAADGAAVEEAADGVAADEAAAPTTAPVVFDSNKLLTDINSVIEKTVENAISGGKKYKIKGGVKLNIVAYQYNGNNINILSSETTEFQTIIRYIIASKMLKNPGHNYVNTYDKGSLSDLLKKEDKRQALERLLQYSRYIQDMVVLLSKNEASTKSSNIDESNDAKVNKNSILTTYKVLDKVVETGTQAKGINLENAIEKDNVPGILPSSPQPRGLISRLFKGSKGGFLDTTRIYNAQGLLSDAVDPLTAASTAGDEVDRVPLPFSSRGSGSITYESDINQDFIADLLPSLGKSGGAKKSKKTRK